MNPKARRHGATWCIMCSRGLACNNLVLPIECSELLCGLLCRVYGCCSVGLGLKIQGSGLRVKGLDCRVWGLRSKPFAVQEFSVTVGKQHHATQEIRRPYRGLTRVKSKPFECLGSPRKFPEAVGVLDKTKNNAVSYRLKLPSFSPRLGESVTIFSQCCNLQLRVAILFTTFKQERRFFVNAVVYK